MKMAYKALSVMIMLVLLQMGLNAQTFADPQSINALNTTTAITVDGVLNEASWNASYEFLVFGPVAPAPAYGLSVTGEAQVYGVTVDVNHPQVRFLRNGMDLFISIKSDDKSVCRFGDAWEGDGVFMKIKNAANEDKEIKLYYNLAGVNPEVNFETNLAAGSVAGAAVKGSNTVVNDTTQVDNGYTMEIVIHLDQLGYTSATQYVEVLMNIFDPDGYTGANPAWTTVGATFYKSWWGSEWGPNVRKVNLTGDVPTFQDPQSIDALITDVPVTVDGNLNESSWSAGYDFLVFGSASIPPANGHTVTGDAMVYGTNMDATTPHVKFMRNGLDLYIGIKSNDKSVCRFGDSWEGDGLFMKIKNSAGEDKEIKLYYNLAGINPEVNLENNLPAGSVMGAAVKGSNTIVNDPTQEDNGYTMELVIHLDQLGYTSVAQYVEVLMNMFDPDGYSGSNPAWSTPGASYHKSWWGSEWGPVVRKINLSGVYVPVELSAFEASATTNGVDLSWTTATEINNRGFEIQRSSNNQNFSTIGFVKGNGTSTERRTYSYFDNNTVSGTYYYRLKQLDYDGSYEYSTAVLVEVSGPAEFSLSQNYPNPFNPSTTLQFAIPENAHVTIKVYDMLGKEITTAVNGMYNAGTHKEIFNASNLSSGNYVYQLNVVTESGNTLLKARSMTLLK